MHDKYENRLTAFRLGLPSLTPLRRSRDDIFLCAYEMPSKKIAGTQGKMLFAVVAWYFLIENE
jgi:hypothetical protein